tara:strand:- start:2509 stop:3372 length:864 start_codon:yes stop_codon:yes gene_type:complete
MDDFYKILGAVKTNTPDEIKQKFRKLQLKTFPEKDKNFFNKNEYEKICQAYTSICENLMKNENNHIVVKEDSNLLNDNAQAEMLTVFGDQLLTSFLNQLPKQTSEKPQLELEPLTQHIEISFLQAYKGCVIPVLLDRKIYKNGSLTSNKETETVYINIPQGIDANEILHFSNKGHLYEETYYDLKVIVELIPEEKFKRRGLDIVFKQQLSLKEALCGVSFTVEHFNQKKYKLSTHGNIIAPNHIQRIPNLGFQRHECEAIGDLIIEFYIEFPSELSDDAKISLQKIL